jgi:hypothetical protein
MTGRLDIADLRREMMKNYLKSRGLRFLLDQDGDFIVSFRWETMVVEYLLATDPTGGLVWFEAKTSISFPIDQVPLLLVVINRFMREHRWPRLSVGIEGSRSVIVADGHLIMLDSLEQDELNRFLDCALMSTDRFWEEFELPNVGSLDAEIISFLQDNQDGAA